MEKREIWIDWLRVAACFMVMVVHSVEPFYLGGEGSLILSRSDAFWVSLIDSFVRACVPLFVVASSYLQFPLRYPAGEFFKRRALRILLPFVFWTVIYALVIGEPVRNFHDLLLNFNYAAGHLWFVYMLAGLYLIMPLLSPWAEKVGKRELQAYLLICLFTSLIPFIRAWAYGDAAPVIFGPSGIPNLAKYPLWGEASWNTYGVFYYLSGFIGYLLLGLYFKKFVPDMSLKRSLCISLPLWISGFALTCGDFLIRVFNEADGVFPVGGSVAVAAIWETGWVYDSLGVVMMTTGWILMFRSVSSSGRFYQKVLLPVSRVSYGMYLCHMLILARVSSWLRGSLGVGAESALGIWTSPVQIILTASLTFLLSALVCLVLRKLPKAASVV